MAETTHRLGGDMTLAELQAWLTERGLSIRIGHPSSGWTVYLHRFGEIPVAVIDGGDLEGAVRDAIRIWGARSAKETAR